jgi:hypothetical protein
MEDAANAYSNDVANNVGIYGPAARATTRDGRDHRVVKLFCVPRGFPASYVGGRGNRYVWGRNMSGYDTTYLSKPPQRVGIGEHVVPKDQ